MSCDPFLTARMALARHKANTWPCLTPVVNMKTLTDPCCLQVVFPHKLDKENMTFDAGSDMRRIGGPIHMDTAQQQVTVEVYVDHSAVEVFLSSGEALATR